VRSARTAPSEVSHAPNGREYFYLAAAGWRAIERRYDLALLTFGEDGLLEAFAEGFGELIQLVAAIDLYGFPGGVHGDEAVLASADVLIQIGSQLRAYFFVEQVI
jgi:hypothetical protein